VGERRRRPRHTVEVVYFLVTGNRLREVIFGNFITPDGRRRFTRSFQNGSPL
jgi:uncharacterized membrane protein